MKVDEPFLNAIVDEVELIEIGDALANYDVDTWEAYEQVVEAWKGQSERINIWKIKSLRRQEKHYRKTRRNRRNSGWNMASNYLIQFVTPKRLQL